MKSLLTFSLTTLSQNSQLVWTEAAPRVWKGVGGKIEEYDLLKASGFTPNKDALSKMLTPGFPFFQTDIAGSINDNKKYLRFPLDKEEQLYEFGF